MDPSLWPYCCGACGYLLPLFAKKRQTILLWPVSILIFPFPPEWSTPTLSSQEATNLRTICSQPFYYLGSGGQCFAFVSKDQKYVIKLFKHKFRKPYSLLLSMPLFGPLEKLRLKNYNRALSKHKRDFTSYKIAFDSLREETGILYAHLNKSTHLNQPLKIVDKLGIEHTISLDHIEFVIQKKAELAYSRIDALMEKKDFQGARAALRSLLEVVVSRSKKGIFDEDAKIHRNFGFIGEKAVVIDVGRFRYDSSRKSPLVYGEDLKLVTGRLQEWLEISHPELAPVLAEEILLVE